MENNDAGFPTTVLSSRISNGMQGDMPFQRVIYGKQMSEKDTRIPIVNIVACSSGPKMNTILEQIEVHVEPHCFGELPLDAALLGPSICDVVGDILCITWCCPR